MNKEELLNAINENPALLTVMKRFLPFTLNLWTDWPYLHGRFGLGGMTMNKEELLNAINENPALLTEILNDSHVEAYLATEQGKKFIQPKMDRYFNKGLESLNAINENPALLTEILNDSHVEAYLATEQGKKFIQPKMDRYFNKGLESWKSNHLESLINQEVATRFPAETPEQKRIRELEQKLEAQSKETLRKELQKRIRELEQKLEAQSKETLRKELTLKAQSFASELGLPAQFANYFVADTEEATRESISKFNDVYKESLNAAIVDATKGATPTVPVSNEKLDFKKMSFNEFAKNYNQFKK